jgi:hypothetical protein
MARTSNAPGSRAYVVVFTTQPAPTIAKRTSADRTVSPRLRIRTPIHKASDQTA